MPEVIQNSIKFQKINLKKHIVYGIVYSPNDPDSYDHFMEAEEIEDMAHRWMMFSQKVDADHDFVPDAGKPVESFIARSGDPDFSEGAWVIGVKVLNETLWKRISKGDVKAFSMAGWADFGKTKELDSKWKDENGEFTNPYSEEN
jgi:hypothetical protein